MTPLLLIVKLEVFHVMLSATQVFLQYIKLEIEEGGNKVEARATPARASFLQFLNLHP
jgi:hypothetical protein